MPAAEAGLAAGWLRFPPVSIAYIQLLKLILHPFYQGPRSVYAIGALIWKGQQALEGVVCEIKADIVQHCDCVSSNIFAIGSRTVPFCLTCADIVHFLRSPCSFIDTPTQLIH